MYCYILELCNNSFCNFLFDKVAGFSCKIYPQENLPGPKSKEKGKFNNQKMFLHMENYGKIHSNFNPETKNTLSELALKKYETK